MSVEDSLYNNISSLISTDFENLFKEITALSVSISSYIKLGLLIWGTPLIVLPALAQWLSLNISFNNTLLYSYSFILASFANTIIISALFMLRNRVNLISSGIINIRFLYMKLLFEYDILDKNDPTLLKIIRMDDGLATPFRYDVSGTTELLLLSFVLFNIAYSFIGCFIVCTITFCYIFFHGFVILFNVMFLLAIDYTAIRESLCVTRRMKTR